MSDLAKEMIKKHEGLRLKPYQCTAGKTTIGYGRNLDDVGVSAVEAEMLLERDLSIAKSDARVVVGHGTWERLDEVRQAVLIDMAFNLGRNRLGYFKKMLAALEVGDFGSASKEMLDSKWARQVGGRAVTLARMMLTGKIS